MNDAAREKYILDILLNNLSLEEIENLQKHLETDPEYWKDKYLKLAEKHLKLQDAYRAVVRRNNEGSK